MSAGRAAGAVFETRPKGSYDLIYSRIAGTGSHLPEKVLTNFDLERMMDTSDEWIRERTGIERRHIAAEGETTVDLAEKAARRALDAAGVRPADVDFIAFGTTTPDLVFPNCGVLLQQRLGCRGGAAFSVETACSGFMYALSIADKYVRAGEAKRALVVGAETLSRITDWNDRSTAVLFADGAGAVLLEPGQQPGVLSTHLHADGTYKDHLYCGGGVSAGPCSGTARFSIRMVGSEVFKVAVTTLSRAVEETLAAHGMDRSAIDWLVPHQANIRILQALARKLELPMERVIVTIQDQGNTSAASVPLALDIAVRDGRIKRGQLLVLEAFGGGFTWGSALVRY
jgi:3-oxoacyl-[acyl-carrier-protein] synthase III